MCHTIHHTVLWLFVCNLPQIKQPTKQNDDDTHIICTNKRYFYTHTSLYPPLILTAYFPLSQAYFRCTVRGRCLRHISATEKPPPLPSYPTIIPCDTLLVSLLLDLTQQFSLYLYVLAGYAQHIYRVRVLVTS